MMVLRWIVEGWERRKKLKTAQKARRDAIFRLHDALVDKTLNLVGAGDWGVVDGFSLRFELMVLLVSASLHRLQRVEGGEVLVQGVWEATFEGFDNALRNRGVTDMGMSSRMRKLLRGGTGRRNAYLAALLGNDEAVLRTAIGRNVFGLEEGGEDPRVARLLPHLAPVPEEEALRSADYVCVNK